MTDWKPVNPCDDCRELREALGRENIYGFNNECQCSDLSAHYKMIYAQKKLLEYLFEPCDKHPILRYSDPSVDGATRIIYHDYRYLCPECMAELRGEK